MTTQTLCLIVKDGKILLGMKKRGFGAGRWNGFGGKVEGEETIEEAMKRELSEESGLILNDFQKRGMIIFEFVNKPVWNTTVHIYLGTDFSGELKESDEMVPQWFGLTEIPYGEMWPSDKYWLPRFLEGKSFQGKILFGEGDKVLGCEMKEEIN
ncbi:MAG TPA: 8-oxo-dGTP diphosphatase [Patescibacteria group bacterium]|nr:8-oxo-dGTP diphosphatase [Patescibacteria group bacterium]